MRRIDTRTGRLIKLLAAFVFFAVFLGLSAYMMSRAADYMSKQREAYQKLKANR